MSTEKEMTENKAKEFAHVSWNVIDVETAVADEFGPRAKISHTDACTILGLAETTLEEIMTEHGWNVLAQYVRDFSNLVQLPKAAQKGGR